MLFELKNVKFPPTVPTNTDFKITGDVTLFGIPFYSLLWVIATVTYPKGFWDLLGAAQTTRTVIALGGKFAIDFTSGFAHEGQYSLDVRAFLGPTTVASVVGGVSATIPPFPSVAIAPLTAGFSVSGTGGIPGVVSSITFSQPLINGQPQPHGITPGLPITIGVLISNPVEVATTISGHVDVFQESGISQRQGDLIHSLNFSGISLPPNGTADIIVKTTADSVIKPKQIRVFVTFPDGKTQQSQLFNNAFYVEEPAGGAVVAYTVKNSVTYSTPQIGQPIVATITITNSWAVSIAPQFRCDIRNDSQQTWLPGGPTWQEPPGNAFTSAGTIAPGQTVTVKVQSIPVPSDWAVGNSLSVQVILLGVSGAWDITSGLIIGTAPSLPGTVSFRVYAAETPFEVTTNWTVYWVPNDGSSYVGDGRWVGIEDPVLFNNVPPDGHLTAYCQGGWPGYEVSPAYDSTPVAASDGAAYDFHIVPGTVYLH